MTAKHLSVLLAGLFPLSVFANSHHYQTYVIDTYGDGGLVGVIQNELATRSGGTVAPYQGKLIIRATPQDFASIEPIIKRLDVAPASLSLTLRVGSHAQSTQTDNAISVGIHRGVWVNGQYQNTQSQDTTQSRYTVRTLSGYDVAITQSTLVGLGAFVGSAPFLQVGTTWLTLQDGLTATPHLLPDGRVNIRLRAGKSGQTIDSTIIAQKGTWTKLGDISHHTDRTYSRMGHGAYQGSQTTALWLKVE